MKPMIYTKEFQLSVKGSEEVVDERRNIQAWPLPGDRISIYLREYCLMQNGAFQATTNNVVITHDVARELCNAILDHIGYVK